MAQGIGSRVRACLLLPDAGRGLDVSAARSRPWSGSSAAFPLPDPPEARTPGRRPGWCPPPCPASLASLLPSQPRVWRSGLPRKWRCRPGAEWEALPQKEADVNPKESSPKRTADVARRPSPCCGPGDSVFAPVLPLASGPAQRRQGLGWNEVPSGSWSWAMEIKGFALTVVSAALFWLLV